MTRVLSSEVEVDSIVSRHCTVLVVIWVPLRGFINSIPHLLVTEIAPFEGTLKVLRGEFMSQFQFNRGLVFQSKIQIGYFSFPKRSHIFNLAFLAYMLHVYSRPDSKHI